MTTMTTKPTPTAYSFRRIPAHFRERKQWVGWRYMPTKDGKWTKVPYQALRVGAKAATTRADEWASFEDAGAAYQDPASQYDGIGYCLADGEQIVGVDVDHAVSVNGDGKLQESALARDVLDSLNTYAELSVSGTGVHAFAFGEKPGPRCKNTSLGFEMYSRSRFLTFTGRKLKGPATVEARAAQIAALYGKYLGEEPQPQSSAAGTVSETPRSPAMSDEAVLGHLRTASNLMKFVALYDHGQRTTGESESDFALIGMIKFYTQDAEQIERLMRGSALVRPKWDDRRPGGTYLSYSIANALKKVGEVYTGTNIESEPAAGEKPVIVVSQRDDMATLHEETYDHVVALNRDEPTVFRRGMHLVRVRPDDDGRPTIEVFSESALSGYLATIILWKTMAEKMDGKDADGNTKTVKYLKAIHTPAVAVKNLMVRPEWDGVHLLRGVVQTPVFLADGSLVTEPGYNRAACLWYDPAPDLSVTVPDRPTPDEIDVARDLLLDVLIDFPFVDEASRAHALAFLLLPYCREMIDGPTPLHAFDAPSQGAGKGLLIEVGSLMSSGSEVEMVSVPRDDENELRKRITAQLLGGSPYIVLDNIDRRFSSAAVASVLASRYWGDRILGVSETKRLQNRAVWAATGINLELARDIARRTVVCRLEPDMEDPYLRTNFKYPNLKAHVRQHRGGLVSAALTLVRAWIVAGRPVPAHPTIGSFESWADTLAGILSVVGVPGLLENFQASANVSDPVVEAWRDFVTAWAERYGEDQVSAADLLELAVGHGIVRKDQAAVDLGRVLGKKKQTIMAGCRVTKSDSERGKGWRLERLTDLTVSTTPTNSPNAAVRHEVSGGDLRGIRRGIADGQDRQPVDPESEVF